MTYEILVSPPNAIPSGIVLVHEDPNSALDAAADILAFADGNQVAIKILRDGVSITMEELEADLASWGKPKNDIECIIEEDRQLPATSARI